MGSLMKSSLVAIPTILGNFFIRKLVPPLSKILFFYVVESMHYTVTQIMVSMPMFSRSMIRINTTRHYQLILFSEYAN